MLRDMLAGPWRLARKIDDHLAGQVVTLAGTASFTPYDGGLLQRDAGQLCLPDGQRMEAAQSYIWRFEADEAWMDYADGRPFISLAAPFGVVDSAHLCGDDHYDVRFDFRQAGDWTSTWRVKGPRKNYVMQSAYSRE